MAEFVTVRNEFGEEQRIRKGAVPFFASQGYRVLDSVGRPNAKATTAAAKPTAKPDNKEQ